jgi:hypothetical protein
MSAKKRYVSSLSEPEAGLVRIVHDPQCAACRQSRQIQEKQHARDAVEDGEPAEGRYEYGPVRSPAIVNAHYRNARDEQEDADKKMSAGSRDTDSTMAGNEPRLTSKAPPRAIRVGPIKAAIVFDVCIATRFRHSSSWIPRMIQ